MQQKNVIGVLAALLAFTGCGSEVPIRADAIYTGGTIYTGVGDAETAEAVAVSEGLIVFTGSLADATENATSDARIVDLEGAVMYPGFTDSHAHLSGVGFRELTLNLDQTASIAELQETLTDAVASTPDGGVLFGRGWIETHWPEGRFPSAADIDVVVSDKPVVLIRADGHALVANTAAMVAAGITDATPDPDGGRIERDEAGAATGMFVDAAMPPLTALLADPDLPAMTEGVSVGAQTYVSRGWTGVHNMSVSLLENQAVYALADADQLPLRVYNALDPDLMEKAELPQTLYRATTRAVKIYMDGALGSRGALLAEPYSDAPETTGLALQERDETLTLMVDALKSGVQLCIHAIGDLGNTKALDWIEAAYAEVPVEERVVAEPRWRIEHAQILNPADYQRFVDLGVIASMQPSHAIGDLHFAPARLGSNRLDGAYAWRDLIDAGAVIAGGSDAPVEVGSPQIEFYAAVERRDLSGFANEDWRLDQRVTRTEALKLFTYWPAYAAFQEDELGTIEPGKRADFTVFDRDLMTIDGADILNAEVVMTIVDGETVWSATP